jgi:hypothetical protein
MLLWDSLCNYSYRFSLTACYSEDYMR